MKKICSVVLALVVAFTVSLPAFAADTADPQQAIETNVTLDTNTDISISNSEAKDDNITKADTAAFKGQLKGQFDELNKLRAECKGLWEQIKGLNQSIKTQWGNVKAVLKTKKKEDAKKLAADLKAKLEPYRQQVASTHTQIKALRDQKKAEWVTFRAAVKERNLTKASTALGNIISLKSQIIAKQRVIVAAKTEILNTLSSVK